MSRRAPTNSVDRSSVSSHRRHRARDLRFEGHVQRGRLLDDSVAHHSHDHPIGGDDVLGRNTLQRALATRCVLVLTDIRRQVASAAQHLGDAHDVAPTGPAQRGDRDPTVGPDRPQLSYLTRNQVRVGSQQRRGHRSHDLPVGRVHHRVGLFSAFDTGIVEVPPLPRPALTFGMISSASRFMSSRVFEVGTSRNGGQSSGMSRPASANRLRLSSICAAVRSGCSTPCRCPPGRSPRR